MLRQSWMTVQMQSLSKPVKVQRMSAFSGLKR
jgi:hypothetical protein